MKSMFAAVVVFAGLTGPAAAQAPVAVVEDGQDKVTGVEFMDYVGKVVIFGALLDSEDRKITSKRFATGLDGSRAQRCALPLASPTAGQFKRSSIAGVYIHATAVHNLMARDAIIEPGALPATIIAIVFAALAALATRMLAPGAGRTGLFRHGCGMDMLCDTC